MVGWLVAFGFVATQGSLPELEGRSWRLGDQTRCLFGKK